MEEKKKILFIAHWYPSVKEPHKGIFIRNHALAMNRVADLLVVDFNIGYSDKIYSKEIYREKDIDGLDVLHIHVSSRFYKFLYYSLTFQKRLLRTVLERENIQVTSFDLITTNVVFPSGIVGLDLAKKFQLPLLHIEHWSYLRRFLEKDFHRKKALEVLKDARDIIVVSQVLQEQLNGVIDLSKVSIVPNVVSSSFCYNEREKKPGQVHFLAIANWRKPKNPFVFIEALKQLQTQRTDMSFSLTLVGSGQQLEEIKQMDLPFPVSYPGIVPNDQLQRFFDEADVFLHGSDYETFSIVPIEALSAGLPVVASRVGVLNSVIDTANGVLCDNTVPEWKSAIKQCISSTYDREAIASRIKGHFSRDQIAEMFREIIYRKR